MEVTQSLPRELPQQALTELTDMSERSSTALTPGTEQLRGDVNELKCPSAGTNQGDELFAALHNSSVLLIDDDPTTLDFVEKFLERAGYSRIVATTDARKALPLITEKQPDIILLDLIMPEVSGFEILSAIRAREDVRYTPVIILTADTDPEAQLKALGLGATDFLTKPVNPTELR